MHTSQDFHHHLAQELQGIRDRIAAHGSDPEPVRALKERVEP